MTNHNQISLTLTDCLSVATSERETRSLQLGSSAKRMLNDRTDDVGSELHELLLVLLFAVVSRSVGPSVITPAAIAHSRSKSACAAQTWHWIQNGIDRDGRFVSVEQ